MILLENPNLAFETGAVEYFTMPMAEIELTVRVKLMRKIVELQKLRKKAGIIF